MDARVTVKENGDFRRIYRRGRSAVSGGVVVYCLKNRKGMSRLGVTVSTKLGHAVVRNRVRRRLRELYRLHKAELLPGYDLIVVARVRAVDMPYAKLEKQYLHCLSQLELHEKAAAVPDPVLPPFHLTSVSPQLPLCAHLLSIRAGSH